MSVPGLYVPMDMLVVVIRVGGSSRLSSYVIFPGNLESGADGGGAPMPITDGVSMMEVLLWLGKYEQTKRKAKSLLPNT
jgi:hypothetical protein